MPVGASPKREREYKDLKQRFKKEHRYQGREEEVAARIVNKQRAQYGETKTEKEIDAQGKSPDRDLPIKHYQHMSISEAVPKLKKLSAKELATVRRYEEKHKNRKGMLVELEKSERALHNEKKGR